MIRPETAVEPLRLPFGVDPTVAVAVVVFWLAILVLILILED